jgi:hypothetical protein
MTTDMRKLWGKENIPYLDPKLSIHWHLEERILLSVSKASITKRSHKNLSVMTRWCHSPLASRYWPRGACLVRSQRCPFCYHSGYRRVCLCKCATQCSQSLALLLKLLAWKQDDQSERRVAHCSAGEFSWNRPCLLIHVSPKGHFWTTWAQSGEAWKLKRVKNLAMPGKVCWPHGLSKLKNGATTKIQSRQPTKAVGGEGFSARLFLHELWEVTALETAGAVGRAWSSEKRSSQRTRKGQQGLRKWPQQLGFRV